MADSGQVSSVVWESAKFQVVTLLAYTVLRGLESTTDRLEKLMLRISENSNNGHAVYIRLDGTLTEKSYAELEAVF